MRYTPETRAIAEEYFESLLPCKLKRGYNSKLQSTTYCITHKQELEFLGCEARPGNLTADALHYRCPKSDKKIRVTFLNGPYIEDITEEDRFKLKIAELLRIPKKIFNFIDTPYRNKTPKYLYKELKPNVW